MIVSATNGKTTTAGMLAAALRAAGRMPVHNRAGSNMTWGVATALLGAEGTEGLFEVDEAWLPRIAAELEPRLIVLGNLFRDQLDRYGELERLADEWADLVEAARAAMTGFVLNADDPLVADLGRDRDLARRPGVTYFGIEDPSQALPELQHAFDAKHCRRCGAPYVYERAFVGHLGHYSCPRCHADRPRPDVVATRDRAGGHARLARHRADARRARSSCAFPSPASTTSTTPSRRSPRRVAPRGSARTGRDARWVTMEAVFGRVETIEVERQAGLDPADQEPRRRQRGPAHAAARGGGRRATARSTCGSRSTTGSPTAATSPGSGTRTSSCWPVASATSLARAPGPPRWRCASSTPGCHPGRSRSSEAIDRSLDRAISPAPTAASSPCPPTRPCSSSAPCSRSEASPGGTGHELGGRLARRRVRRL